MTDPTDAVEGMTLEIDGTPFTLGIDPADGGVKLTATYDGETIESGTFARSVFTKPGERNKFLSNVEAALEDRSSVDAAGARAKFKNQLAAFGERGKDEIRETFSREANEILEGTQYPVEVYRGEPTTWKVTVRFRGELRELNFTTSEMNGSGGALEEKIANHFLEFIDIAPDEWEHIRDEWSENKRTVDTGGETAQDAIADRVLERLGDGVLPLLEREKLVDAPSNAWLDEGNTTGYGDAPPDATIVWVQDRYLVDKLESAGKSAEYKGQLLKDLISRGDLYGKRARRRWSGGTRRKYYPFAPEALRVDPDTIGPVDEEGDASDEVEP